ncbi:translation initiation factor IF-3 [Kocuria rosea]|uniref:translation initiation factor IF-3 n=2 Tax=Kocuria TaxID=57493 RepID=UPI000D657E9B|nr:translation initiation factor IF-3 [Kocuria rosea]NVC24863.1 translation initiation factor IF-3 [Kocuria salina]PWF81200.1 translation initiation factor IF-3 [Kocuria rosea]THE16503.1 translation initiation factor IF-3 [Kocuria rosea]WIG19069.1 translation initiation factor IF-3 [Kocuria rosea]
MSDPRINDRIRVPEVRLVGPAGEQVGIVRVEDALRLARESDLDLVEVAPNAKPPVAKLMDFGKYKYEAAVKARESRKNQTNTVLKEVRFRLKIDTHDYETKVGHAKRFLGAGDKVKAMIQFRGREQQRPEMGVRLLERFANDVAEVGAVESSPRVDGRNMVMVVGPLKNKAEAKAEARRQKQRDEAKAENERKAKDKIDTSSAAPVTQSIGDAFPAELRERAGQAEEPVQQPAPEPEVQEPAPAPEVPETAQAAAPEPEVAEPEAPEAVEAPEPEVAEAPEVVEAPAPKAAPKPPAPKAPAPTAPAAAPKAPRPGPKPGAKPGPQA